MLKLFNTLTRKIEPFNHGKDTPIKMYTCGPSTYQRAHIGNYRTFIFEDLLQRYLEYLGYKVTRLITLTDVEDKAISEAKKEKLSVEELTIKNETVFFKEFNLLKIKTPDFPVRASTAVDQAVELITKLVGKGYAYWYANKGEKNAYFDPLKFSSFGKLAHLDMSKWPKKKRRFHKDTYPGTPWNRGDFILWHGCKEAGVCWETKIGSGRPAWNIQDAAIVTKNLGFSIDIACGGIDNLVRHHDYTLAVAEAVSGKDFCGCWLHGGHLFVNGEKMSKSKGNVYYLNDILEKGFRSDHLRFFMVYSCYREKLDFTFQKFADASHKLDSFKSMVVDIQNAKTNQSAKGIGELPNRIIGDFEANMNNDLDAKTAIDHLHQVISELHGLREKISATNKKDIMTNLKKVDSVLQCLF